jgi:hypothetical protein
VRRPDIAETGFIKGRLDRLCPALVNQTQQQAERFRGCAGI